MMILGENVEQIENRKERQNLHSDMYLTHGSKGPLKIISSSHYLSIVMNHEAGDLVRNILDKRFKVLTKRLDGDLVFDLEVIFRGQLFFLMETPIFYSRIGKSGKFYIQI
ncbi:uncharacterized protein LOC116850310 isoform X1 [Odontomachus brunneus]|uniref:uncharacterized protein LOC116850310 isoform X1 n=1 Tax=Odontomachus brunneus TaxID=486640 RepID=UPI0013F254ED|nr:uncharacterized protein LOC116850310 isoform X1 [Odontomachus brunneus]